MLLPLSSSSYVLSIHLVLCYSIHPSSKAPYGIFPIWILYIVNTISRVLHLTEFHFTLEFSDIFFTKRSWQIHSCVVFRINLTELLSVEFNQVPCIFKLNNCHSFQHKQFSFLYKLGLLCCMHKSKFAYCNYWCVLIKRDVCEHFLVILAAVIDQMTVKRPIPQCNQMHFMHFQEPV